MLNFHLKTSMVFASRIFDLIEFLQLGVNTNWFGLGCPLHCGGSSFPALALAFITGLTVGFSSCLLLAIYIFRLLHSSSRFQQPVSLALDRLRGYSV